MIAFEENHRIRNTIMTIAIVLLIAFLSQETACPIPDKLAPASFFSTPESSNLKAHLRYISTLIEKSGISPDKLTLDGLKAILNRHNEEAGLENNIIFEGSKDSVSIILPSGYALEYYKGRDGRLSSKLIPPGQSEQKVRNNFRSKEEEGLWGPERVVVIGDDYTGSLEVGLEVKKAGYLAIFLNQALSPEGYEEHVKVYDIGTRYLAPKQAYEKAKQFADNLRPSARRVYFKIDSTLRGRIGQSIRALRGSLRSEVVVVVPALPENGRITEEGIHYVIEKDKRIPLHQTQYAQDPITPIDTSSILELFGRDLGKKIESINLPVVREGWGAVKDRLEKFPKGSVVVIDAAERGDLDQIAEAIRRSEKDILACGSTGLFQSLIKSSLPREDIAKVSIVGWKEVISKESQEMKGVLFVIGSLNERTNSQIEKAKRDMGQGVRIIELGVGKIIDRDKASREIARVKQAVRDGLEKGKAVILKTSRKPVEGMSRKISIKIAKSIGRILKDEAIINRLSLLFLTGGDTIRYVTQELRAGGMSIESEVEPYVPLLRLIGGVGDGKFLISKAGGFGSLSIISNIVKGMERDGPENAAPDPRQSSSGMEKVMSMLSYVHEPAGPGIGTKPILKGAQLVLSEGLFDAEERITLDPVLKHNENIMVLPLRDVFRMATNQNRSRQDLIVIMTEEEFNDPATWHGLDRNLYVKSGLLLMKDKLAGPNYLYLEGVIKLATAILNDDRESIKRYYVTLTGSPPDEETLDYLEISPIAFAIKAIITFKAIEPLNKEELDNCRRQMEIFLASV